MENEIKVGEYVRLSRNQGINKIIDITEDGDLILDQYIADEYAEETVIIRLEDKTAEIINHSFNVIDLIEEGDYVNGKLIHKIDKGKNYCYLYYGNNKTFVNYQIKSIVTKEQFKNIEYEV